MTRQVFPVPARIAAPALNLLKNGMFRGFCMLGLLLAITACSGAGTRPGGMASGTGGSDKRSAAAVEADIACTRRCNHDMAVCEDAGASRFNRGDAGFGTRGQCQRQLSQCLQSCQPTPAPRSPAGSGTGAPAAGGRSVLPPPRSAM